MKKKIYYKGFDKNLRCSGFQYEIGKSYTHKGEIEPCKSGFHACEYPLSVFNYYAPANSRFSEVEARGKIVPSEDKIACEKLKIKSELSLNDMITAAVKFTISKVEKSKTATNTGYQSSATNTGYYSAATNTGYKSAATNTSDYSAATNTGYYSAATNTGKNSAATNTGKSSAATNTGDYSAATNTGNYSAATNTGDYSAATNTGYQSAATNTGDYSAAMNTGYQSSATNTGDYSAATNTGDYSAAMVAGKDSIACGFGYKCKAKGAKGCWLVLAERDKQGKILNVKTFCVDGKNIKENFFYVLENGKLTEAE